MARYEYNALQEDKPEQEYLETLGLPVSRGGDADKLPPIKREILKKCIEPQVQRQERWLIHRIVADSNRGHLVGSNGPGYHRIINGEL